MEIRSFAKNDEEKVRSLFELCFGREMPHKEWAWKYKAAPWGSAAAVSLYGDEIVSHYGGIRMKFYSQGRTLEAFQPCDVMTHPKYRARIFARRGAMIKAGEHFFAMNRMDFAFGFPSERHAILGTKQLGYTEHDHVTALNKQVSGLSRIWSPLFKVETGWDTVDRVELDALWERVRNDYPLLIEKNSSYIFWRYRDNPAKQYEPLIVKGLYKKDIKAFAVFSIKESRLSVLDFFCAGGMKMRTLFKLLENTAVKRGLDSIELWVNPNEAVFQTLTDYGYKTRKDIPYIFKIQNREINPSFLFEKYCYRMGDCDSG